MQCLPRLNGELTGHVRATLRGCAQLAFCESPYAGLLVLGGIALVSPFGALGALLGSTFGTLVGRFVPKYSREEWSWGIASFNPAIVGLAFGGFLASGERSAALLVPILVSTVLLDALLRPLLARAGLPSLSASAMATLYAVSAVVAPAGGWFWTDAPAPSFVPFGVLGAGCIAAAMLLRSPFAGLWAIVLGAIAYVTCGLAGQDPRTVVGLWAVTIPLASFGVHAVFLRGSLLGCAAGTLAALAGASIWIAWESSPVAQWLPPLLAPFILGTWLALLVVRRALASPLAGRPFWSAARALLAAHAAEREVAVLLANDATRLPGPSPYFCGAWLGADLPRFAFERASLRDSLRFRRAFWEACARARSEVRDREASALARRVGRFLRGGWARTAILSNPLAPAPDARPEDTVRLHGDVRVTRCMDCSAEWDWPPQGAWRRCDLRCVHCHGPVIPAVTPFGAPLEAAAQAHLRDLAGRCAAVLVLGNAAGASGVERFLADASRAGAATIFVADHDGDNPPHHGISVRMSPVRFVGWAEIVLRIGRAVGSLRVGGRVRQHVRGARGHGATG